MAEATYASQLVRPFGSLLKRYPMVPEVLWKGILEAPASQRWSVRDGQAFLAQMVELTGDPDLGLKAAQETHVGAFDVLEYVALSAATRRGALQTVFRYIHLMNGAADFSLNEKGAMAQVELRSRVPLTRAGIDFQSAALFLSTRRWFGPLEPGTEVLFSYAEPEDTSEHRAVFAGAELRFGAPFNGFRFTAAELAWPLRSANPDTHAVLRAHLERLAREQSTADGELTARVRAALFASLSKGPPNADNLAQTMGIARRTLTRRLSREGASFNALLSEVRRQAGKRYLAETDHTIDDIAFLLGYSESSAFVRAFRRWEGQSPAAYRRALRQR